MGNFIKKLGLVFLLSLSIANAAYVPSAVGTITLGGVTNLLSRYTIFMTAYNGTSANYSTFNDMNTAVGHQASGTVTCEYLIVEAQTTSTPCSVQLLYGDTDVGISSASAPTTPIYRGGPVGSYSYGSGQGQPATYYVNFTFPNGKYAAMRGDGVCNAQLYCF